MNSPASQTGVDARKCNFGSAHTNGANFVMCDGSVHFLTLSNVSGIVNFQRLSVPNDGNPVTFD